MEEVEYINGRKYILASVAEGWKEDRDKLQKRITKIHVEVHAARRDMKGHKKVDRTK